MLSSAKDPYYVARDEVQLVIQKVQSMHDEWRRLLHSENTAKSVRFQELHSEIAGELHQLDFDLQDITETIRMVEDNRAKFKFDDAEVASRREFVKASRGAVKDIKDSITSRQALGKIEVDKRQALGAAGSHGASVGRDERQGRAARDGQQFLERQRQEQGQIIARQDQDLSLLSQSAQRLGETARAINAELQDHKRMLEALDEDMDRETEKLNFVMKRMGRLLKTSDNKQLCLITGLFLLLVVLIFLVINT